VVKELLPAKSNEFPTSAKRPLFTGLEYSKFIHSFNLNLPHWKRTLEFAMVA